MKPILYESTETAFTSNGLGRLRDCISFKVTEERNNIFEADFEYPVGGAHFDDIIAGRIVYATHDESKIPQPFDIIGYSKPISGVVTFHAVHVSYRQLYLPCYGSNINSLSEAFALFATAQPSNPFSYEADFSSTAFMAAADGTPRSVRQMIGGVEGSLLDTYGGELEFDHFRVILHSARGVRRDFTIRYGVNMTDYVDDTDYSGTYSSCVPFWHGQDSVGQELTVVGNRVDTGAVTYNGRNDCVPLDLTEKFETKPTRTQLQNMAAGMMQTKQPTLPSQNIRVDFVRLQDSAEYEQFSSLLTCNLCDTIGVSFPRYNMTGDFKIVRTVYDTLADRYDEMELGALSSSLSEALGITTTPTPDRINENFYVDADGNVTTNGSVTADAIILQNGSAHGIKATDANEEIQNLMYVTNANNVVIGYPWYTGATDGDLYIGGETLRLRSINPIVSDAQFSAFYKITTVAVEVAAISAHANRSATTHAMTAQSGYNAVGIVGWRTTNFRISPATNYVASNTGIYAGFKNTSATATTSTTTVTFQVLWLKATSA